MNHRVVANGTPLDARFDNIARAARRAGYAPALYGYTDQAIDPRDAAGPTDPRLSTYEEVLPGFAGGLHLPSGRSWLRGSPGCATRATTRRPTPWRRSPASPNVRPSTASRPSSSTG